MDRARWYLVIAGVFAIHNAEEALGAATMIRQLQGQAPDFLRTLYAQVDVAELRTGLVVLTALGLLVSARAAREPETPGASFAMLTFAAVMGLNAVAHVALSVVFREYMPGLLTAAGVTLPVSLASLRRAWLERWMPRAWFWAVAPAAVLIHGPLLAAFVGVMSAVSRL